jgi:hypothetical protein
VQNIVQAPGRSIRIVVALSEVLAYALAYTRSEEVFARFQAPRGSMVACSVPVSCVKSFVRSSPAETARLTLEGKKPPYGAAK